MKKGDNGELNSFAETRTLLANERTLLAYIRTFFSATILAVVLFKFFIDKSTMYLSVIFFILGIVFLFVGIFYFIVRRRRLKNSMK